jgi:hypothetical protein
MKEFGLNITLRIDEMQAISNDPKSGCSLQ